jgi:5-methylcytosine-specific restriction protein A
MKAAVQLVFRRITPAEFYNIYKPKDSEPGGGGQTYIDFPISKISFGDWSDFFAGETVRSQGGGPSWDFTLRSLGVSEVQQIELSQRRGASFSIRRQTLGRRGANRVFSWHPDNGFPRPKDPRKRQGISNLVVYMIRSTDGEYWAGWFQAAEPSAEWAVDARLLPMFSQPAGIIKLDPAIRFDETNKTWPFVPESRLLSGIVRPESPLKVAAGKRPLSRGTRYRESEEADVATLLEGDYAPALPAAKRAVFRNILIRNQKAVRELKRLYKGECQLTGSKFSFRKSDGSFYSEAHHLLALGDGGADSPFNLVIVSPLVHRMFHYAAEISGLDLSKIRNCQLDIRINGDSYTITWHPKHADLVLAETTKR